MESHQRRGTMVKVVHGSVDVVASTLTSGCRTTEAALACGGGFDRRCGMNMKLFACRQCGDVGRLMGLWTGKNGGRKNGRWNEKDL